MMIFKKYHIPKKAVSVLLAFAVLISTLAIIWGTSFSASALTVNGASADIGYTRAMGEAICFMNIWCKQQKK